jgi:AcrR family transcriptional regulator
MRDKEATKQKIIDTAITLFKQKGFVKVSTLEVAEQCKIAHGTVFFHFGTRSELIVACIYKEMNKLGAELNESSRHTDDIRKLCELFLEQIGNYREFYSQLVKDLPHLPIDTQRIVFASLSGFSVHFVDVIEKAQASGKIRSLAPKYAMFYWFGVINYIFTYDNLLSTGKLDRKSKNEIIDFFIASLTNLNFK